MQENIQSEGARERKKEGGAHRTERDEHRERKTLQERGRQKADRTVIERNRDSERSQSDRNMLEKQGREIVTRDGEC